MALLAAIGLIVGAICSKFGVADPFLFFRLARVEAWASADGFVPYPLNVSVFDPGRPLYELALAGIRMATGLSAHQIATIPVGAVAVSIGCYALCYSLIRDRMTAFLIALALMSNHSFAGGYLGTFIYTWSTVLFFAFLVVLWKVDSDGKTRILMVALVCVFVATESLYQTTATWMIAILAVHAGVVWLRDRHHVPRRATGMPLLAIGFAAYFVYFDRNFSDSFLRDLGRYGAVGQLEVALNAVLAQLSLIFLPVAEASVPYQYVSRSSSVGPYVVIAGYGLLATALIVEAATLVGRRIRRRSWVWTDRTTFLVAVVVGAAIHTVAYAAYGAFNPRVFGLLGGVMGTLALFDAGLRTGTIRAWALTLAALSIVGLVAFFGSVPRAPSQVATSEAADWLLAEDDTPVVSADLGVYGRLLLTAASHGRTIHFANLDSCGFAHVVQATPDCGPDAVGEYVVIDGTNLSVPLNQAGWRAFGPPSQYWAEILANSRQSVVYDHGGIVILQRHGDGD